MALDAYGKRFCEIKFVHHDRPDINRRTQHIQLIGSDGVPHDLTGNRMPHKLICHPPSKAGEHSITEILLDEPLGVTRPTLAVVELRPRWPKNRDILHMALPLVALGLMRLAVALAQQ